MQVGRMRSERMQNTHTLSVFPSIMFAHDLQLSLNRALTHTSPEREQGWGVRGDFGRRSWRERFGLYVSVCVRTWSMSGRMRSLKIKGVSGEERGDTEGVVSP